MLKALVDRSSARSLGPHGRKVALAGGLLALVVGGTMLAIQAPALALTVLGGLLLAAWAADRLLGRRQASMPEAPAADERTILGAYRFFLGREPESEQAMADKRRQDRHAFLRDMLTCNEYDARLIAPLLRGAEPSGGRFDSPPDEETLAWAATDLPLEDGTRRRLRQVADWGAAHAAVLTDRALRAAFPELDARLPPERTDALAVVGGERGLTAEIEDLGVGAVRGYALDRSTPDRPVMVELWIDGAFAAARTADVYRRDLEERFGGAGAHGFVFEDVGADRADGRPVRMEVRDGATGRVLGARRLTPSDARDARGLTQMARSLDDLRQGLESAAVDLSQIVSAQGFTVETYDAYWRAFAAPAAAGAARGGGFAAAAWRPRFEAVVVGRALDLPALQATEGDLAAQTYPCYRTVRAEPGESALDLDGDYVLLIDAGDRLAADALARVAEVIQGLAPPDWISFDSDTVEADGRHARPVFRPGFDPDLLLQTPYLGASTVLRCELLARVLAEGGSLDPKARGDLWLRVLEASPGGPTHLARVLLHRRPADEAVTPARYAEDVRAHLARIGAHARVSEPPPPAEDGDAPPPRIRVAWPIAEGATAAVIVPTRDRMDLLGPCLASLERSRGANRVPFEIIVVDNASAEPATLAALEALARTPLGRVIPYDAEFNWSAINTLAASQTRADVLIFLNNDTVAITPEWCDVLCAQALRPQIGAVGARLLFGDGSIQHAGVVLGTAGAVAAHEGAGASALDPGYLGRRGLSHRTAAVTGACLATRRTLFHDLGGFDAEALGIEANDIDYCLRVRAAGLAVLYEPDCTLYHFESRSRGHTGFSAARRERADRELAALRRRWGGALDRDPFYNAHFDRRAPPFTRLGAPPKPDDGQHTRDRGSPFLSV